MPSFIFAGKSCALSKEDALKKNIHLCIYSKSVFGNLGDQSYINLKDEFAAFCAAARKYALSQNPKIPDDGFVTCDMLLFTSFDGVYEPVAMFNHLNVDQIYEIVQIALNKKINFRKILVDCCCAPFGLNKIDVLLCNGGEAIGDRTTSNGPKASDLLIENLKFAKDEKSLVDDTFKQAMPRYNAPCYLFKLNSQVYSFGTMKDEIKKFLLLSYQHIGIFCDEQSSDEQWSALTSVLPKEVGVLESDLQKSIELYSNFLELEKREQLLVIQKLNTLLLNQINDVKIDTPKLRDGFFSSLSRKLEASVVEIFKNSDISAEIVQKYVHLLELPIPKILEMFSTLKRKVGSQSSEEAEGDEKLSHPRK